MSEDKAPAGWQQDPSDPTQLRYWDGSTWTEHIAPQAPPSQALVNAKSNDKKFYEQWWFFAIIGLVVISAISQLTSSGDNSATPTPTVTVTEEVSAEPVPAVTVTKTVESKGVSDTNTNSSPTIKVPDAVGMDYQTAQDLWRNAGLTVMPAEDALGLDRFPVIDSNWVVISQKPVGGSSATSDSTITATVKKFTD